MVLNCNFFDVGFRIIRKEDAKKKFSDCCEFDSFIVCAKPQSLMVFGMVMKELKANIDSNKLVIESALRKNPGLAYNKVNELARSVGRRYNMELNIHFPDSSKIKEISSYGTENIGIIIDKFRKKFPIPREDIKRKAIGHDRVHRSERCLHVRRERRYSRVIKIWKDRDSARCYSPVVQYRQ